MEIIDTTHSKPENVTNFTAEQTFLNIYFPSTITDTSHIPSINHNRHLSYPINYNTKFTQCAEVFKPHYVGTYIFFLTPKFPMIGLDQLKYWLGLVNIGLDWLISVRIG